MVIGVIEIEVTPAAAEEILDQFRGDNKEVELEITNWGPMVAGRIRGVRLEVKP